MTKSILITGCSTGIGLAAALALKDRGYRVFATARKETDVAKLKALGLESFALDVTDDHSIQTTLDQILNLTHGTLDALFNNAGFMLAGGVEDMTRERMQQQFETNTFGAMEVTRRVLPIMRRQGHGRIIQNSSILGVITMPYYSAYNASKFALEAYSDTLRQELRGTNIKVIIICPGPITSNLRNTAFQHYQNELSTQQTGVYRDVYQKLEESYFKPSARDKQFTLEPNAVVAKVILALENKHPRTHYFIGFPAKMLAFLNRILPVRVMDWLVTKVR